MKFLRPTYKTLENELFALRVEKVNYFADVRRVLAWVSDPERKSAVHAFTEGPERQLAYKFEELLQENRGCICRRREPPQKD